MEMLKLSHVEKSFGDNRVIQDLSLTVKEHTIYGFIGPNGAGKTTTMKMILGLMKTDGGAILVNGESVTYGQTRTNRYIGYLPDVPEFYSYLTPMEYLALCGEVAGMEKSRIRGKSLELLELVGLGEKAGKRMQGFSRGMKQRLGIAQALLHSPKLLICDEPTSALDPVGRKEILDILGTVKEHTTVVFSTHILSDVERICDEIGLLYQGSLAVTGTLEEIRHMRHSDGFELEFHTPEDASAFAAALPGCEKIEKTLLYYPGKGEGEMREALRILTRGNLCPLRIEQREPTLENLFLEVTNHEKLKSICGKRSM